MATYRLAVIGSSYARDLFNVLQFRYGEDQALALRLFGGGGQRLINDDGSSFESRYLAAILAWHPHYVIVWVGGNDLNEDLRDGRNLATDHYKVVFDAHKSLCDALVDGTRRWGAKVIMMPIIPRTNLRYDMTPHQYFVSMRRFNAKFNRRSRRRSNIKIPYEMAGFHAFREDGSALRDGVHLKWVIVHAICVDIVRCYCHLPRPEQ